MNAPWNGPRHRSWASNTVLTLILLVIVLVVTVLVDHFNGDAKPPDYLTALLGTAAGAFFTAIGSDTSKRRAEAIEEMQAKIDQANAEAARAANRARDVNETALTAEAKSDVAVDIATGVPADEALKKLPPRLLPKNKPDDLKTAGPPSGGET